MGLGKLGRLRVGQPTNHWRTPPSSGRIHPLFACDDCSFVERLQAGALLMKAGLFFLETGRQGARPWSARGSAGSLTTRPSWDAGGATTTSISSRRCRPPRDGSLSSINSVAIGG